MLVLNNYTAGITSDAFYKYHMTGHEAMKGGISSTTSALCPVMCEEFRSSLDSNDDSGERQLMNFVQEAMFQAVTRELFGRDNVPKNKVRLTAACAKTMH